ncbi:type II secretion system protein N [Fluviicoccus keumensis]|nr:type II secretion system protein N [Fluviicoccus keumensis]
MKYPVLNLIAGHNRKLAQALMLLAVLWFGWRLAGSLWLVTGQDHADLARPPAQATADSAQPDVDTGKLAGFSLFKSASPARSDQGGEATQETSLQLRLDGVFAGSDPKRSGAIIADQGQGVGKLYAVGQSVPGGAILESVHPDKVVLSRNGSREVLRFVKTNLLGGDAPPSPSAAAGGGQGDKARQMLSSAIDRLGSEPGAYLSEMGLVAGGEGYEITDSAPANIRRSLGLKAGDKILRLNGQPLGNPQLDRQLLEQVKQSGHVRVDVRRGSQTLTIEQNF